MILRAWRFITITLTALLMGATFCHVLESPAKMRYPAELYLTLHRTLYVAFGPPNIGVFVEPANVAMKAMPLNAPPAGWTRWRDQWEYGHIAHFIFHLLGFSALALSIIFEISVMPVTVRPASAPRKLRGPFGPRWRPER